ncbi:MAG: D-alanyl-D-alanine carboxypeptidase family protein [Kiloniellaceae bacterium]
MAASLLVAAEAQARYASIVVEFETGRVLHRVNADTRNYPASLVKMMTLYLAFEALERGNLTLDQELPVSRRAAGMPASKLGLKAGDTIAVRDVILALVTKSANDAAVVVAEALGTKETRFARMMTKKARALGMKRTSFRNATGLPNRRQLSTARDMASLARALIRDFPQYYEFFSTTEFTYGGRTYRNHNTLLRKYDGADGLKTGYIRASGFNLAASAVRDGRRLIAVVLGGKSPRSRDRHVASLLDRSFARLVATGGAKAPARPPRKPAPAVAKAAPDVTDAALPSPGDARAKPATQEMGSAGEGAPARTWGVQVGAYYRYRLAENAAVEAAARLPELLGDSRVFIPTIKGRRGRIYRARLVGLTKARASKACARLEALKTDCLVVRARSALALQDAREAVATN